MLVHRIFRPRPFHLFPSLTDPATAVSWELATTRTTELPLAGENASKQRMISDCKRQSREQANSMVDMAVFLVPTPERHRVILTPAKTKKILGEVTTGQGFNQELGRRAYC